jgi:hypothetical protein
MRWAIRVAYVRENRNAYEVVVGKPEGSIESGTARNRKGDNKRIQNEGMGESRLDSTGSE